MAKIKITADSTCDIGSELKEKLNITIMPLTVTLGNEQYKDLETVFPKQIFEYVEKNGVLPKTAAASPDLYISMFEEALKENDAVIHFNLSSKMSASNQNANIAAKHFDNVYVIDSASLSSGTALLMLTTHRLASEGVKPCDIIDQLEVLKPCVQASFVIDELDFLHKGGRCSGLAKLGAAIFRIHPMLLVKNGEITVEKKIRGKMDQVYLDYIDNLSKNYPTPHIEDAFVTFSLGTTQKNIDAVIERVKKVYSFKNLYITTAGSTITSHCGKGTLGLLFINDKPIINK